MYRVTLTRSARRELDSLPESDRARVLAALRGLEHNPRPPGCLRLTGYPHWRIRVGSYRIIYEIDDPGVLVTVIRISHRRDAYR